METFVKGKGIAAAMLAICAVLLCAAAPGARAQGSRKDDVVFNAQGRPLAGATVRICQADATGEPCSPLASIYSDEALTKPLANPLSTDGMGNYTFYAVPGRYMIEISGPGITTKQIPDVILPSDPSAPTFTSLTTTSGISAFSLSLSGNLTVNGSAAVVGSLTVGGAPVPSTNQDNRWTAEQRFRGPIPYADATAFMPPGGCSLNISNVSDIVNGVSASIAAGSTAVTLTGSYTFPFVTGCGVMIDGAGPASTLTAPASPAVIAHNQSGSTTFHYCMVAVDNNEGYSACSATATITTSDTWANLTDHHYNFVSASSVTGAVMYCVYGDEGLGGSLLFMGCEPQIPYFKDKGWVRNKPTFLPATAPASAGAEALFTTIASGGGTSSLTLANTASTTVSGVTILPDISSFIASAALERYNSDQSGHSVPVLVPAGKYIVARWPVAALDGINPKIIQIGDLYAANLPWDITYSDWDGSWTSYNNGGFETQHMALDVAGPYDPAMFVLGSGSLRNVSVGSLSDIGIFIKHGSAFEINHVNVSENATAFGCPLEGDADTVVDWISNSNFTAGASSTDPRVCGSQEWWPMGGANASELTFDNDYLLEKGIWLDNPRNISFAIFSGVTFRNTNTENNLDNGILDIDTGSPSQYAYAGGLAFFGGTQDNTRNTSTNFDAVWCDNSFSPALNCGSPVIYNASGYPAVRTAANSIGATMAEFDIGQATINDADDKTKVGLGLDNSAIHARGTLRLTVRTSDLQNNPPVPALATVLPPPTYWQVTGTGASGGLADDTYCAALEGKGFNTDTGGGAMWTQPTQTVCTAISGAGGAGSINYSWSFGGAGSALTGAYAGLRFFFCVTTGSSCTPNQYLDLSSSVLTTFTFATTSGTTVGTLSTGNQAYMSWLDWDRGTPSCLFCASAYSDSWPLGIGVLPTPGNGVKLDVAGGTIRGQGGLQAGTDAAFNASPRGAYSAFLPNLTASAGTFQRMTLDKGVTVTRVQLVLGTAGAGCSTQGTVSLTDGTNSVTLTTSNGTAIYDSGPVSQNFAAGANLDIRIATPAAGCSTAPQDANVAVQYRMQ